MDGGAFSFSFLHLLDELGVLLGDERKGFLQNRVRLPLGRGWQGNEIVGESALACQF